VRCRHGPIDRGRGPSSGDDMAAPSSSNAFIDLVRRSGVVETMTLDEYVNHLGSLSGPEGAPKQIAQKMIRDGLLTGLQASLLLKGKWRNFVVSGKYKLLEPIGTGGMGAVYLCEHVGLRRQVALKILPVERVTDPLAVERFRREARAVAALDHDNIVRIHDI